MTFKRIFAVLAVLATLSSARVAIARFTGSSELITSDGNVWKLEGDEYVRGDVIVIFDDCGTSDVTDDVIVRVI